METPGFNIRSMDGHDNRSTPLRRVFPRPGASRPPPRRPSDGSSFIERVVNAVKRFFVWLKDTKDRLGWKQFIIRCVGIGFLLGVLYVGFLWLTLPNLDDPTSLFAAQSTVITDRNGIELYRLYSEEDRTLVPNDQISKHVKDAVVAIEDSRYYTRGCLDVRALARVVLRFGSAGGASTLSRQLARNALNLQNENIVSRKLKELILGCELEHKYGKEEVLGLYLNWIPFGQNAYGVEQASQRFFGINAKDLSVAQSAVLASLPQLPTYFSPYGKHVHTKIPDALRQKIQSGKITSSSQIKDDDVSIGLLGTTVGSGSNALYIGGRTDQVLHNMKAQGYISDEEEQKAILELRSLAFKPTRENIRAPHFVLWVKDQVEKMYEQTADKGLLEQGGLTIETTLDWRLQQEAERAVSSRKDAFLKTYGAHNMALVSVDPQTREILAYVGNADYGTGTGTKIDMAQVPRQPGSSFKPFAYAAAFLKGYSPATPLYDIPTKFGVDEPSDYDGTWWGPTTIRKALGGSRNIPAIKGYFLGGEEDTILDLADKMGIPSLKSFKEKQIAAGRKNFAYGWPLALGAGEAPLVEMVNGYATFAAAGKEKPLIGIRKITRNKVLLPTPFDAELEREPEEVLDPRVAYQITSVLSDASARPGEFWQAALTVPGTQAAAKTGTSNKDCPPDDEKSGKCRIKPNNLWTMGYTPTLATGVWVGNADSTPMSERADGLNLAAPIWKDYMTAAQKILKPTVTNFTVPDGMVQAQVSMLSGELPTECTPVDKRSSDVFLSEYAPSKPDPACVQVEVDKVTGLLASDNCPAEAREMRSFLAPIEPRPPSPLVAADWDKAIKSWTDEKKSGTGAMANFTFAPTEKCDISLTPGRLVKPTVKLVSPGNGGSVGYPSFKPKLTYYVGDKIQSVSFTVDGKPVGTSNEVPLRNALRVPKTISKAGPHTLEVTLTDNYYNTATDSASFTFGEDVAMPSISITSPTNGATVTKTGNLTVTAASDEAGSGIKYVEFFLDSTLLTRKPREPFTFDYPMTTVIAGPHTVKAIVTDLNGQTSEDSVTVNVQ